MRYIITGATGFIGQKIIEKILKNNDEVIAIVRPSSKKNSTLPKHQNLSIIECDLNNIDSLYKIMSERKIPLFCDYFIHLGWNGTTGADRNNKKIQLENIKSSLICLELAKGLSCKSFFFAGSQAEYGNILYSEYQEQKETNKCNPINEYGKAKLNVGELLSLDQTAIKKYHGRIFSVYGPKDQPNSLISSMLKKLSLGEEMILGPCEHDWNFTYIEDIAEMIISLVSSQAQSGIYNLASQDTRKLKEFIQEITTCYDWPGRCLINGRQYNENSDIPLRPNNTKITQTLNLSLTSFKKGIEETINYELKRNLKK